jgi:hypothetical protein
VLTSGGQGRTCGLAPSPGLNCPVPLLVKQHSVYPAGPGKRPAPAVKMADLQAERAAGGTKKTSLYLTRADAILLGAKYSSVSCHLLIALLEA